MQSSIATSLELVLNVKPATSVGTTCLPPSLGMAAGTCLEGRRPLTAEEVAVGTKVTYISQDTMKPDIHIKIIHENIIDGIKVVLKHKSTAHLNRIFVSTGAEVAVVAADGGQQEQELPADGGESLEDSQCSCYVEKVIEWLNKLSVDAQENNTSLVKKFEAEIRKLGDIEKIRTEIKRMTPWSPSGYLNFQVVPTTSKSGKVHVSFLAW